VKTLSSSPSTARKKKKKKKVLLGGTFEVIGETKYDRTNKKDILFT
jgi:hypothetical protein